MSHELSRRNFLRASAAGTALLTMPGFVASCARNAAGPAAASQTGNPMLAWFGIDEPTIRRVMAELTSTGADHADLYFQHSRASDISMEDGIVASARSSVDLGVGVRAVMGDRVGYSYTEELTLESMLRAARNAAAIARGSAAEAPAVFRYPEHRGYYATSVPWSEVGIDRKLPLLQRVEGLARQGDPAITKVAVKWSDEEEHVLVADLAGNIHTDVRPMTRLFVMTTAQKGGKTQTNGANIAGRQGIDWYTEERLREVARQAVDRTMILFEAIRPPAGELPVALAAGASGILLHEAIGHGLEADFNRKGTSIYADMLGRRIAPEFVTIVDDGTLDGERGSLAFDDEGTPCERTVLVENGVLRSYLHDRISARHYGIAGTGSGRRQSFRHAPLPRMRCTFMENGPHTKGEIIAAVDKGIIAETFTNGQVQIGAGDFTFYIKNGWLIEGGKITAPIKDVNIIGNGPEALRRVTMAADDAQLDTGGWTCGKDGQGVPVSQGLPTVLVSAMTVGGTHA